MNWNAYKQGQLAKSSHGYYFVFQKHHHEAGSNRWFIEYEPGTHAFGDHGMLTGRPHGFETFEEAQAYAEKDAEDTEKVLG
jgi:hypothetical protein